LILTDVMGNGHCGTRTCMALDFQRDGSAPPAGRGIWEPMLMHTLPNATLFWMLLCLPTPSGLPL
jgi:hypothetical protein